MTTWMTRLFGGKPILKKAKSRSELDNPATTEDNSESGMRRQLVHVLLRDSLHRHGINPRWIECQILVVTSRSRGTGMYVRFVVRHWDERLMHYLVAFQKSMRADLLRFEPRASEWLHGISWQLELENECPYLKMPDKSFWLTSASTTSPHKVLSTSEPLVSATTETRLNLNVLNAEEMALAVRKANAARRASPMHTAPGALTESNVVAFSPTVPSKQNVEKPNHHGTAAALQAEDDATQDLRTLFAIRDHELGLQAPWASKPLASFEKTQPSPL
jgi:hypothetical protein